MDLGEDDDESAKSERASDSGSATGGERGIGERATRVPGERRVYDSGRLKLTYVLLHEPTCFRGLALGLIGRHPVTLDANTAPASG